jgi:hypothetical protein
MTEQPLDDAHRAELDDLVQQGYEWLGGLPHIGDYFPARPDDPLSVATSIRQFVDGFRERGNGADAERFAFALGAVYGHILKRAIGWSWILLETGGAPLFALVPPDRSVAIRPQLYLYRLLSDRTTDNTVLLQFNMLTAGQAPQAPARSYTLLG